MPSIIEIPLTQGKFALVDDDQFDEINQYKWYACKYYKTYYVKRNIKVNGKYTTQYMHNFILQRKGIDHINLNGLDNRLENLRVVTRSTNGQNCSSKGGTSQYKGVCWDRKSKKWKAEITIDGRNKFLGYFDIEIEAAVAYDAAALECHGELAYLNFR